MIHVSYRLLVVAFCCILASPTTLVFSATDYDQRELTKLTWEQLRDASAEFYRSGDTSKAYDYAEAGVKAARQEYGSDHPETAVALKNLSTALAAKGNLEKALVLIQEAYDITLKTVGSDHIYHVLNAGRLADILRLQGKYDESEFHFTEATTLFEDQTKEFDMLKAATLNNYALLKVAQGNLDSAREYFNKALDIKRKLLGSDHPDVRQIEENLKSTLQVSVK